MPKNDFEVVFSKAKSKINKQINFDFWLLTFNFHVADSLIEERQFFTRKGRQN